MPFGVLEKIKSDDIILEWLLFCFHHVIIFPMIVRFFLLSYNATIFISNLRDTDFIAKLTTILFYYHFKKYQHCFMYFNCQVAIMPEIWESRIIHRHFYFRNFLDEIIFYWLYYGFFISGTLSALGTRESLFISP